MRKLLFAVVLFSLISCEKKGQNKSCTWEVEDRCTPKTPAVGCTEPYHHYVATLLNGECDVAATGKTVITHEDENVKQTRTYIKRID